MRLRGPHPRIRRTIKWGKYGGATLTVLLVVVWIGSGWYEVKWIHRRGLCVMVAQGRIDCLYADFWFGTRFSRGGDAGWHVRLLPQWRTTLSGLSYTGDQKAWVANAPMWPLIAAPLLVTALAFRLDTLARRRANMNLCKNCHYDRTGLPGGADAVCPECGTATRPVAQDQ